MAGTFNGGAIVNLYPPQCVVDVKDPVFGALGNGNHDDGPAIAAAIQHAQSLYDQSVLDATQNNPHNLLPAYPGTYKDYYGVVLFFPPGRYYLGSAQTSALVIERPLRVSGAGYNESILVSDQNRPILTFSPDATVNASTLMIRGRIEDLGFRGSYQYRTARGALSAQDGLKVTRPSTATINTYVDIHRCQFFALGGAGIHSVFAAEPDGDKFFIDGCYIYACGDYGIRFDQRNSTAYITRNHITNNAGGIGLFGTPTQPVSTVRVLDNIIEANDGGPGGTAVKAGDVAGAKPFVGVYLANVNFAEIAGNYFEWQVNGVYVADGCRNLTIARNWFDGNDVNLPKLHAEATGSPLDHQLSPVYAKATAGGSNVIGLVIEENDCYVPSRPANATAAQWSPSPNSWPDTYEVFPVLDGSQHELIRNSARLSGGRRQDATYAAAATDRVYFESVQYVTAAGDVIQAREATYRKLVQASDTIRLTAPYLQLESAGGSAGAFHQHVYPAGLTDPLRTHNVLSRREANGSLTAIAELWYATDHGFTIPRTGFVLEGTDYAYRRIDTGTQSPAADSPAQTWVTGSIRFSEVPTEQGATGAKYTLLGWRCTSGGTPGTWVAMRTLTGN